MSAEPVSVRVTTVRMDNEMTGTIRANDYVMGRITFASAGAGDAFLLWLQSLHAPAAELSALKARRCDGCAHWRDIKRVDLSAPVAGHCDLPGVPGQGLAWSRHGSLITKADFSCAAWTEKP